MYSTVTIHKLILEGPVHPDDAPGVLYCKLRVAGVLTTDGWIGELSTPAGERGWDVPRLSTPYVLSKESGATPVAVLAVEGLGLPVVDPKSGRHSHQVRGYICFPPNMPLDERERVVSELVGGPGFVCTSAVHGTRDQTRPFRDSLRAVLAAAELDDVSISR